MRKNICQKIEEQRQELSRYPDAYLVYKNIHNKKQPYLQWHEDGKTRSRYVKMDEREYILTMMDAREQKRQEYHRLCACRDYLMNCWKQYPSVKMQTRMVYPVGIGHQSFAAIQEKKLFYIDKSMFIREWWEDGNSVNLILRPRRFGKTLNMDMVDCFFSVRFAGRSDWFEGLQIWQYPEYQSLQGTWPVIHLSFAAVKSRSWCEQIEDYRCMIQEQYLKYSYILESEKLTEYEKEIFRDMLEGIRSGKNSILPQSICRLSQLLHSYYDKKVILLVDEYDTPLQEAWNGEDREQIADFLRRFFNYSLKSNPYMEKALLTGITRISRESMFSDLNHLKVSTVTEDSYAEFFGFTEAEVFAAMDSQELENKTEVKAWYDGFRIGEHGDIYNPWSIANYLQTGQLDTYWVNTSSNHMVGELIRRSGAAFKEDMERLMLGECVRVVVREDIVYQDLDIGIGLAADAPTVWGLLLASGYLRVVEVDRTSSLYTLAITNYEVRQMFDNMFRRWFSAGTDREYSDFVKAMLGDDVEVMQDCLNEIVWETFSIFDVGGRGNARTAENFYHGFFLGMISTLRKDYRITSNRESGRGRYDCMLEPRDAKGNAVIIEFKVRKKTESLEESAEEARKQIDARRYAQELINRGFNKEQILCYGIAFDGKDTWIVI